MKLISLVLSLIGFMSSPIWLSDFDAAKAQATEKNQHILLNFCGSDWCAPCIRMKKEIFEAPDFVDYAEQKLVLVKADFPRNKKNMPDKKQVEHNEALAEKYNPEGKFPFTVLLDATGKLLKTWDGLPKKSPVQFIDDIQQIIKN